MLKAFQLNAQMKNSLKALVELRESEFNFIDHPQLAGFVASLGIHQEVGTLNDELHRHIYNKVTNGNPSLESMQSEIVSYKGRLGVRVFSSESENLHIDNPQIVHLMHPEFSRNARGDIHQLVFFPQTISEIIALQEVELIIVKDWALNTVFGGFSSDKNFYVTNEWEIRQNDGLRMARLMTQKKLAFFGTHDLTAHVAGTDGHEWKKLSSLAKDLIPTLSSGNQNAITHLIIPYIIGVLLDDLAQPNHYSCQQRLATIGYLSRLQSWAKNKIPALKNFHHFPKSFSSLIEDPRRTGFTTSTLKQHLRKLSYEVQLFGFEEVSS